MNVRLPAALSALGERDFRIVWIGQAISLCGTWMQTIAQGLVVLSLWKSPFALGVANFANALPTLAVTLFGGVLADRADKRRILLVTQVFMAASALVMGTLIATGTVQFWMIICVAVAMGIAIGYDMPAYASFGPELVPPQKIGQVVALNSSTFHGSRLIGPAFAGVVIAGLGLSGAFFLNAASFVAVIISLLLVRNRVRPVRATPAPASALEGLRDGFRHVRSRPHLTALMLLGGSSVLFVFPPLAILMPYYVTEVLGEGPTVLAAMMASSGLGSVVGAIALIFWSRRARVAQLWFGVLTAPSGFAVLATTRVPFVAYVATACVSIAFSSMWALVQTMMQESTPDEYRGRVSSLFGLIFSGVIPFAGLGASALSSAVGLPTLMVGVAAAYALTGALILRFAAGGIRKVLQATAAEYDALVTSA